MEYKEDDPIFAPTSGTEEDRRRWSEEMMTLYLNILKRSTAPIDAEETKNLYGKR